MDARRVLRVRSGDEANRIFGFDAWDRRTLKTRCIWTGMREKQYATAYTARVRIRVRAGDVIADVYRERVLRRGKGSEVWGWGTAYGPGRPGAQPPAPARKS